jgi:TatD DNase family protein
MFVDTHCHVHEPQFFAASDAVRAVERAHEAGVNKILCIGTSEAHSREAVRFAADHDSCYAVVGVHPHDSKDGVDDIGRILSESHERLLGVGEIGLDYFYTHSPREVQIAAFERQLQWAHDYALPVSFHVREAFEDFWPIFDNFSSIRGVLHSFTDNPENLEKGLARGLYVGLNGISTFTKDEKQRDMYRNIPLDRVLLETDAPFLTPAPHRGKVNEPAFVRHVAEYHANQRGVELEHLARVTSANASTLFSL